MGGGGSGRSIYNSKMAVGEMRAWHIILCLVVVSPIPLGSNRPVWSTLLATCLLVLSAWSEYRFRGVSRVFRGPKVFTYPLLLLVAIPFIQLIPLPLDMKGAGGLMDGGVWRAASLDYQVTFDRALLNLGVLLVSAMSIRFFSTPVGRSHFLVAVNVIVLIELFLGFYPYMMGVGGLLNGLKDFQVAQGISGSFVNKNHYAGLMELMAPFVIWSVVQVWVESRVIGPRLVFGVGLSVMAILAIAYSGSRAGSASFILGFMAAIAFFSPRIAVGKKHMLGFSLVLLLLIFIIGFLVWDIYSVKKFNMLRFIQWKDSLSIVSGAWIIGVGLGTYEFVYPLVKSPEMGYQIYTHAHNDYLEYLVTGGVVYLGSYLVLVIVLFRVCYEGVCDVGVSMVRGIKFPAVWGVISILAHGLMDFNMQIPSNYYIGTMLLFSLMAADKRRE